MVIATTEGLTLATTETKSGNEGLSLTAGGSAQVGLGGVVTLPDGGLGVGLGAGDGVSI